MTKSLAQIAAGTAVPAGTQQNVMVSNPNYCNMNTNAPATKSTIKIDPNNLIQNACGYFEMDVDSTSTSVSAAAIWGFGGGIVASNGTINKQLYKYPSNAFAVDTDGFKDAFTRVGTLNNQAGSSAYLNEFILGYQNILVGDITFRDKGSNTGVYTTLASTPFIAQTVQSWGNFYQGSLSFDPDLCNPCFNDDTQAIHWGTGNDGAPISASTPLSILIPEGTKGTFRFCTKGYAPTQDFIEC